MSKSYFVLIALLLFVIAGIVGFAYLQGVTRTPSEPVMTLEPTQVDLPSTTSAQIAAHVVAVNLTTPISGAESRSSFISVAGITAPNSDVAINEKILLADADGKFSTTLILDEGENPLIVSVNNDLGETGMWEGVVHYNPESSATGSAQSTSSALVAPLTTAKLKGSIQSLGTNEMTITAQNITYTVSINSRTKLVKRYGGKITFPQYKVGDEVIVVGQFSNEEKTALTARVLRNMRLRSHRATITTKIKGLGADSISIDSGQFIDIPTGLLLTNRLGSTITIDHLRPGDTVKITGSFDPDGKLITDLTEVRDLAIPLSLPDSDSSPSGDPAL